MSTEVMHTLEEDKEHIQKQLGCMNGIFHLFDPRYLLGQRGHGNHHKKLPQGQSVTSNNFNNASDKLKDQKQRESVESSRNALSSSCSSLNYSKRVQTGPSSVDIRDVVKESMTRKPRVVSVKTVAKGERKGPKMTHVDSPRLLQQHAKHVTYERRDQNLVKLKQTSGPMLRRVQDVKQASRFSYDDRESSYKLKSLASIENRPRLSLDSKQSNSRPPLNLVARLMGLDLNCEPLKIKPCFDNETISVSRDIVSPMVSNALTRIPLEPTLWKQEVKQQVNKKVKQQVEFACQSVYDQFNKRLTEIQFKTSDKDLRDLKHTIKPANLTSDSLVITTPQKVKKVNASPRHQRSKITKQSNEHWIVSSSKTRDRSYRDACHIRNSWEQSDTVSLSDASVASHKVRTRDNKDKFAEQPSPISVLDAFYSEDTPLPIRKKSYAFKDDDDPCFDEPKWSRFETDDLINIKERNELISTSHDIKHENIKQLVHQIKLSNSTSDINIINPLIFDTVNNTVIQLLARSACRWRAASRRNIDGQKLITELWFEINNHHMNKATDLYELINIITEDVNKKLADCDDYCNEVPDLVFDMERLVFNDLITEIVNTAISCSQ